MVVSVHIPLVIIDDFNIHIEYSNDTASLEFNDILSSYGLEQHVHECTHTLGGNLYVAIAGSNHSAISIDVEQVW